MPYQLIFRLSVIDKAIRNKNTGTPAELAGKMRLSERCIRNYIHALKELGAPIVFSRRYNSYYYKEDGYFCFKFTKNEFI